MAYDPDFDGAIVKRPGWAADRPGDWPPYDLWTWVYLANLPVATFLGFHTAYGPGLIGMVLGVAGVYAGGRWRCRANPRAFRMVSYGGLITAALQIFPLLHIFAGVLGIGAASVLGQYENTHAAGALTLLGGLIATLVTGIVMISLAGVAGFFILAVRYAVSPSFRATIGGEEAGFHKS